MQNKKNLTILNHPIIEHNFSILRDKNTDSQSFRNSVKIISNFLIAESTKNIKTKEIETMTPIAKCKTKIIDEDTKILAVPILRAGLAFVDCFCEYLPNCEVVHIGMYREKKTLSPVWYLDKTKESYENAKNVFVYILDPMLATGNSAKSAIELLVKKNIPQENISFVSLIAVAEGIENIHTAYPDVKIITAKVDEKLNEKGYIVPGLGDAGDRLFNTVN